ncbi:hypothetical protein I5588_29510 [Burkholderia multivorans]|uniref:hypothetical protein n=1 Tax=Burkholderia multivorans TaxID=87883 RepID=UPI0019056889|nr:hypothetical protein [Burkholderia multivorans]MBJ9658660.1 hypothetical protein [Burkholderia multivorans]
MEIIVNIVIGVLTGLYAGLIVARAARFNSARSDLVLAIQKVGYRIDESGNTVMGNPAYLSEVYYAIAQMTSLGHSSVSPQINSIGDDLLKALKELTENKASDGPTKFNAQVTSWQKTVRALRPDWCQLLVCGQL